MGIWSALFAKKDSTSAGKTEGAKSEKQAVFLLRQILDGEYDHEKSEAARRKLLLMPEQKEFITEWLLGRIKSTSDDSRESSLLVTILSVNELRENVPDDATFLRYLQFGYSSGCQKKGLHMLAPESLSKNTIEGLRTGVLYEWFVPPIIDIMKNQGREAVQSLVDIYRFVEKSTGLGSHSWMLGAAIAAIHGGIGELVRICPPDEYREILLDAARAGGESECNAQLYAALATVANDDVLKHFVHKLMYDRPELEAAQEQARTGLLNAGARARPILLDALNNNARPPDPFAAALIDKLEREAHEILEAIDAPALKESRSEKVDSVVSEPETIKCPKCGLSSSWTDFGPDHPQGAKITTQCFNCGHVYTPEERQSASNAAGGEGIPSPHVDPPQATDGPRSSWTLQEYAQAIADCVTNTTPCEDSGLEAQRSLVRTLGEEIDNRWGFEAMQQAWHVIHDAMGPGPCSDLTRIWDGVGRWQK